MAEIVPGQSHDLMLVDGVLRRILFPGSEGRVLHVFSVDTRGHVYLFVLLIVRVIFSFDLPVRTCSMMGGSVYIWSYCKTLVTVHRP